MKRALRQLIRDSPETEGQFEATAQFLEDLALHADHDIERSRYLSAAREFRLAAQKQGTNHKGQTRDMKPR
jgi:alkyl sulfatase BDS1-like metallo-beta-lactamase superfamily hydrolase